MEALKKLLMRKNEFKEIIIGIVTLCPLRIAVAGILFNSHVPATA